MRVVSGIIQKGSGSVGGYVWSHNAGGMYLRARSTPTDPGTARQVTVRAIVASLVNHWATTLTAAQRTDWNTYAENVPLIDVFGDPRIRSGINHYVRSNTPRLQAGYPRVDAAPTTFNLGEYTQPTFAADSATQQLTVTFGDTDDWCSEDNSAMYLYHSSPKAPTIDFFKGPFRYGDTLAGSVGAPPASPIVRTYAFTFSAAQKLFIRANVSRADGRLGSPTIGFCIAT